MPNITEYTNPVDGLNPSNEGIEAAVQSGRRIGTFYHQIGQDLGGDVTQLGDQYNQHAGQQEILAGSAHLVKLNADIDQQINDFAKRSTLDPSDPQYVDPNNHAILGQAQQQFADVYDNFGAQFKTKAGQAWAQENINRSAAHVYEKTSADMSTMAGLAAVRNLSDTVNTSAAAVHADPSSLSTTLDNFDTTIAHTVASGTLDADTAGRLQIKAQEDKAQMVMSAARGRIELNPKAGTDAIESDPYISKYLKPEQQEELRDYGTRMIRSAQADAERETAMQDKAFKDKSAQLAGQYIAALGDAMAGKGAMPRSTDVLKHGGVDMTPEDARTTASYIDEFPAKEKEIADRPDPDAQAATFRSVLSNVAQGKFYDPAQLYNAHGPRGLSGEQIDMVQKYQEYVKSGGPVAETAMKALDNSMTSVDRILSRKGIMGGPDPQGSADAFSARSYYYARAISELQAGVPFARVLDPSGKDPASVFHGRPPSSFANSPMPGTTGVHPNAKSGKMSDADAAAYWKSTH